MLLLSNYENRRKHNNDDSTRPTVNDNDISLLFPYFFSFFRENANRVKEHERERKVEWMRKWEWVRQRKCIKKKTQILEFTLESFSLLIYLILIKKKTNETIITLISL